MPVERLTGSYLHMHANRMLRAAHRAQEAVLYHFLERLYESRVARQKPAATGAASAPAPGADGKRAQGSG